MEEATKKIFFDDIPKIRWACRRGMLELDVLLGNFLKEAYLELAIHEKNIFIKLLNYSDPELFAWLLGHAVPEDKELAFITEVIRQHAQSRVCI